jgi:hypothetical protein
MSQPISANAAACALGFRVHFTFPRSRFYGHVNSTLNVSIGWETYYRDSLEEWDQLFPGHNELSCPHFDKTFEAFLNFETKAFL